MCTGCGGPNCKLWECAVETTGDGLRYKLDFSLVPCTFKEFSQSWVDTGASLDNALKDLNGQVASFGPELKTKLRGLIDTHLLQKINRLVDKDRVNCKFINTAWQGWLDGFCYETVTTISSQKSASLAAGIIAAVLAISTTIFWRYQLDNRQAWKPDAPEDSA